MEKEIWKDIKNHEGKYMISNKGNIMSLKLRTLDVVRILKPGLTTKGYPEIKLWGKNGKRKGFSIHRLLAEAFIPNPDNKPCVNHINGIKNDNRIDNLEWNTYSENTRHGFSNGLISKIKNNPNNGKNRNKKIINKSTGEIYSSLKDCSEKLKLDKSYISSMLTGYKNNTQNIQYIS